MASPGVATSTGADALHRLSANQLAARIRSHSTSSVEAVSAALARIEALNPSLAAVVSVDPTAAMAAASRADAHHASGAPIGPLHGVPITLKDGHDVAGLRTTVGTDALDRVADRDGAVAARLRAAGAIVIGHSNVPPLLADYQSENTLFGRTLNPWDLGRTPGGSSGGAACAVAAGLTPLEVGSDMTGSLRLPASFCGIYGLKPTEHRVPLTGFLRPTPGTPRSVRILLALGPMARDLADLDLVLTILAGPDGHDSDVAPVPVTGTATAIALKDLRVAAVEAVPGATVGTAMRSTLRGVADGLTNAGSIVTEQLPPIDWDEADALFLRLLGAATETFVPGTTLDEEQRSLAWYLAALDRRDDLIAAWSRFFENVDVLVLPAAMAAAFPHADPYGSIAVDGQRVSYLAHGALLTFANLAGLPALVVPGGSDPDGLPLGIQLVGPRWSETRLIAFARAMESAGVLPGHTWPDPAAAGAHRPTPEQGPT